MGQPQHQKESDATILSLSVKVLAAVAVTCGFVTTLILIWHSIRILLAAFAGILLAIFLRKIAIWTNRFTHIPISWSVGFVLLCIMAMIALLSWVLVPNVAEQAQELRSKAPQILSDLRQSLGNSKWGSEIVRQTPSPEDVLGRLGKAMSYFGSVFSLTMNVFVEIALFLFVGLYLAFNPGPYIRGLLMLVPSAARSEAGRILQQLGQVLYQWTIGRLLSMAVVGVLTSLGLWILGIPLVLFLALIAALLTFIPNIGPVLSLIPAVLVGLMQSMTMAVVVMALYLAVQLIESYAITPLIQKKAIRLPPAIIILAQVIMGILVGALGLLVATPLTALIVTLVRLLYVEKIYGTRQSNQNSN